MAINHRVHARAHKPDTGDLFTGTVYSPLLLTEQSEWPHLEFDGILLRKAEVRNKTASDGLHAIPVVCIDMKSIDTTPRTYHVEMPFTDATRLQAEQLARSLTKGKRITATAPLDRVHITFTNTASIAIHQEH